MRNKLKEQEIDREVVDLIRNATKLVNINTELKKELEETKQKLEDTKKELFEQYDNLDYEWKKEEKAIKILEDFNTDNGTACRMVLGILKGEDKQ